MDEERKEMDYIDNEELSAEHKWLLEQIKTVLYNHNAENNQKIYKLVNLLCNFEITKKDLILIRKVASSGKNHTSVLINVFLLGVAKAHKLI